MKTFYALAASLLLSGPAAAQSSDWEFSFTGYAWFTGLSTSIDTNFGTVESDLDFHDILSDLDFAVMGVLEARNDRWSLMGDLMFTDLSSDESTPLGVLFSEAETDVQMTLFSGYAAYRVYEDPNVAVDLGGGFRVNDIDVDLSLAAGTLPATTLSGDETWVDPLLAARVIVPFSDRWSGTAFADIGGFGITSDTSDLTWQALATVNYEFNERWSARFGYRYLSIDRPIGGRDTELEFHGPVVGVTARF